MHSHDNVLTSSMALREGSFFKESSLDVSTPLLYAVLFPISMSHILFSPTAASHVYFAFYSGLTLIFFVAKTTKSKTNNNKTSSKEFPQFSTEKQGVLTQAYGFRKNNLELFKYKFIKSTDVNFAHCYY